MISDLASRFEGLINSSTNDPSLQAARSEFVKVISKRFRGTNFVAIKEGLVAAAKRCGAAKAENLTRETLYFITGPSLRLKVVTCPQTLYLLFSLAPKRVVLLSLLSLNEHRFHIS